MDLGKAFNFGGTAVSDIFAGFGAETKAQGDLLEAQEYQQAAAFAFKEAAYTKMSTAIQEQQETREVNKALGQTTADIAGAGFATKGSSMDILRESASQGAITKAVVQYQGLIKEEGYRQQAQSYETMAAAANMAAGAEKTAATGDFIGAGISAIAMVAML
jgi:hypothetical protein